MHRRGNPGDPHHGRRAALLSMALSSPARPRADPGLARKGACGPAFWVVGVVGDSRDNRQLFGRIAFISCAAGGRLQVTYRR